MSAMYVALLIFLAPDLAELHRFPSVEVANSRIGFLNEQRHYIQLRLALDKNDGDRWRKALNENGHALACWEALLVAHGGLAEEEGGDTSGETRESALGLLRQLLGEREWATGQMP